MSRYNTPLECYAIGELCTLRYTIRGITCHVITHHWSVMPLVSYVHYVIPLGVSHVTL